ncbi:MAG: phosphatase PAP2 family protein [Chlorobium limicola]|uniref:Phosphoesterase PA-phosphatase related n=1 Tax=Chlorobium limicola (strain DSM 245 / NBRC 103803 / 6330) TaxID=290315 RepID=B3EH44_CHLL2|nr:phosphatase PAP2 family protein [Chlorobium limicola]ACD89724.1 phosphoesterase PA-phosphatase related [Chlorobium limicola DSM 245]NTV20564.1 phosphatase PAP2 family protein [Chlorobium limicola]
MTARHYWIIASATTLLFGLLSYLFLDIPTALWFANLKETGFYRSFKLITRMGESQWYLATALLCYLLLRKTKPAAASSGLLLFSSVALSGLSADLFKFLLGRARPKLYFRDAIYGFDFFHLEHAWTSFPSGHSATAFSVASTLCLLFPRYRIVFFLWAALIAFSRVATTQHYLSDVLAGSLLGAASTAFLYHRYFKNPSHALIPSTIR